LKNPLALRIVLMTADLQVEHLLGELSVNLCVLCIYNGFNAENAEKDAEIAEKDSDILLGFSKLPLN